MRKLKRSIFVTLISITLFSCASTPPQAPELSMELGKRISLLEQSHKALVTQFFNEKRLQVNTFLSDVWLPEFANSFFSKPSIEDAWNTIVSENNKTDRLKFILTIAPKIQIAFNQQRQKLITPINQLEDQLLAALSNEYSQAHSINSTLTSYLTSASKVSENRERYLEMLSINSEKYVTYLNTIDGVVSDLTRYTTKADQLEANASEYLSKLKELRENL